MNPCDALGRGARLLPLLLLAGCAAAAPQTRQGAVNAGPADGGGGIAGGMAEGDSGGSPWKGTEAGWSANPARLEADIRRALRDLSWGRLSILATEAPLAVQAAALLPDGRRADIRARATDASAVAVTVRVGLFGDEALERRFIKALARRLAGKPARTRGGSFELP